MKNKCILLLDRFKAFIRLLEHKKLKSIFRTLNMMCKECKNTNFAVNANLGT